MIMWPKLAIRYAVVGPSRGIRLNSPYANDTCLLYARQYLLLRL